MGNQKISPIGLLAREHQLFLFEPLFVLFLCVQGSSLGLKVCFCEFFLFRVGPVQELVQSDF